jgi:hypothetical protein
MARLFTDPATLLRAVPAAVTLVYKLAKHLTR